MIGFKNGCLTDGTVQFENLTNSMGVLVVSGPKARELMTKVSRDDFSAENFKWLSAKDVNVGNAPVNAMRVNFVGELGGNFIIQLNIKTIYLIR